MTELMRLTPIEYQQEALSVISGNVGALDIEGFDPDKDTEQNEHLIGRFAHEQARQEIQLLETQFNLAVIREGE